jgi:mono/diheme cytochrome c family protein
MRVGKWVIGAVGWLSLGMFVAGAALGGAGRVVLVAQKAGARKKAKPKRAAVAKAAAAMPEATKPGNGSGLMFSKDIAPIFVANCIRCHNPQQRRGKFDLTTFQALMKGADAEKVIIPGKPEESPLVLHIKGEADPKMPPGNNNLSDEAIAKIEQWVKAGALLDAGIDPKAPLNTIAPTPEDLRRAELAKLSPAERDKRLETIGRERWKKVSSKGEPQTVTTPHFLMLSELPKDRAQHTLKELEKLHTFLGRLLVQPGGPPTTLTGPEKISIYVFNNASSYAEFLRGVENREYDPSTLAHGNFSVEAPYLVALDPLAGGEDESLKKRPSRSKRGEESTGPERSLLGLLAEQLGVAAANQAGKTPQWLSLGLGAYLGARVEPRSPYYRRLRVETIQQMQLGWKSKAEEALGGATDNEKVRALGFSLIEWLATEPALLRSFVIDMLEGQERLDDAIRQVWGPAVTRENFLSVWGEWVAARYGGGR